MVADLEILVRTAVFKSANQIVGWLLQRAAQRSAAAYPPQPGEFYKGQGHYPVDDALGLEVGYTPALAKLLCLEGAEEQTYLKAQRHWAQTGGIPISARQIQRVVQRVGRAAQAWQERPVHPGKCGRAQ